MDINRKYASVNVLGKAHPVAVAISSDNKPSIATPLKKKWQNLVDAMAECLSVPAGLIMKLDENKISVFLSSRTEGNPYRIGDSETLLHGLYCETVAGTDSRLLIPDATEDQLWKNNPDIKLGMISYLGYPIKWPDGEIFGTICVLDTRKNRYSGKYLKLMEVLKESIEEDLVNLLLNYNELLEAYNKLEINMEKLKSANLKLERMISERDLLISEIHHRVKNNMQVISSLIELQSGNSDNPKHEEQLFTIKDRILAMGIVHETLYQSDNFRDVRLKDYISKLINNLDRSLVGNDKKIDYQILIDRDLSINFDSAVPFGLIVNEIVTNSIKYAFPDKKNGRITVAIYKDQQDIYYLEASDNGCGIPEDSEDNKDKGMGRKLISLLADQLDGTVEYSSDGGTAYSIMIKMTRKEENRWTKKY